MKIINNHNYKDVSEQMKIKIKIRFENIIENRLKIFKESELEKLDKRFDYDGVLSFHPF